MISFPDACRSQCLHSRIRRERIVASCPHCFHTLGKEYPDYGADKLEVLHHSQILAKLQDEGRLPRITDHEDSVTFMTLVIWGGLEGGRSSRAVIGGVDVEVERHGTDSLFAVQEVRKCGWRRTRINVSM